MSVREVSGDGIPVGPLKPKKSKAEEPAKSSPKDTIEVSGEAKSLFEAGQVQRFEEIRQRLANGYYNSPEVAAKVVDALLADLKKGSA